MIKGGWIFGPHGLVPILLLLTLPAQTASGAALRPRESQELVSRFQETLGELAGQVDELVRFAAKIEAGVDSEAMFNELARRQAHLTVKGDGTPSLSIWSADGKPLSWAGPAGPLLPATAVSPDRFQILEIGVRVHFRAQAGGPGGIRIVADRSFGPGSRWYPLEDRAGRFPLRSLLAFSPGKASAAGSIPLVAPDGMVLGRINLSDKARPLRSPPASGPPLWILTLASLPLAATLLCFWQRRRHESHRPLGSLLIASTGLWILRFLASLLLAQHPALVSGELSGPRLFAFPVPMNLARSPLDILLTGLVLLGQAALLLRFSEQGKTLSWRRWAPVLTGALALPMAVWIVSREAQNSQMSLIEVSLEEHFLARSFVQVALLLILWAPLSLLAPLIRRRRQSVILAMLVALPAASLLTFLILTASFLRGQETLVERNLKLQVLDQEDDRIHTLDESRLSLMNDARLPAYLDHELGGGHGSNAAYRLWTRTELARMGYRSSLELFDAQGNLQGHFGIEMPPSVPAGPNPAGNLQPVDLEKVLFSTLSQQEEVYTCRWPVMEEGKVVGGLALYVSNGFDNIPLLRPSRPNWLPAPGHRETPPVRAILGEDPVAMTYDSDRRLLWTARPDPPPPPSRSELQALVPSGEWRTSRSAGHAMRLFYFRHGDILSALGYALSRPLQHLSRLFRLGTLLLLSGGSLLLFFFLILLPIESVSAAFKKARFALGSSYARKLGAVMMTASLIPLLLLSLVQHLSRENERREILFTLGLQSLDVARRVVLDAMAASGSVDGAPSFPSDDTLFWLSRVIHQDIDLFVDGVLISTSRRGIYTADLLPPLPPAHVYRELALGGRQSFLTLQANMTHAPATISGLLRLNPGPVAILSLPLRIQQAEMESRLRESQEQTTLAAVAITLLLMLASILLGRRMAARVQRLTRVTERLARGDTSARVAAPASMDEIGRLTRSFNGMAKALAQQSLDLQARTETLDTILRHAPTGIICMDGAGRLTMINPAALDVLQMTGPVEPSQDLAQLLHGCPYRKDLDQMLKTPLSSQLPRRCEMAPHGGREARVRAVLDRLPAPAGGRILILEDITETIRSNRLAAWAEMARRIAHEIKNPLTPIRLSAEHLRRVYESHDPRLGEILESAVETILTQVEVLRETSSDFSIYARIPVIRLRPLAIGPFLERILAPYQAAPPPGLRILGDLAPGLPVLPLDERLLRRAVVNLLENALQATSGGGTVTLSCRPWQEGVLLKITDTGHGMDAATCARIFEADFSTRETGTGLGLVIARRAIREHGGTIEVDSRPGRGTTFTVRLPRSSERTVRTTWEKPEVPPA